MCRTGMCRFGFGNWIFLLSALHLFTYAQGGEDLTDYGVRLTAEPADTVAAAGDPAILQCAASPGARVSWRHSVTGTPGRDHELAVDDLYRHQLANGSLVIESMSLALAGRYQCVAAAAAGRLVSRIALLMIAEVPEFLPGPSTVHAVAGAPAILPCPLLAPPRAALRVRTDPPARRAPAHKGPQPPTILLNITWTLGGVPVPMGPERALLASGALELDPARVAAAGQYVCRVALALRVEQYKLSPPITLQVSEAPAGDAPPRFVATPQSATVIEGASVTFECAAAGSPRPDIVWLHNGVAIDLSELDSRYRLEGSSSLTLWAARPSDGGAYTCRALSALDAADHTATLTVLSPPRVWTGDPPAPPGTPALAVTWERADVTLRCSARGRPSPTISWLKDGEPLTPNQRDLSLVDGSSLRIAGVLRVDAGMFQCGAMSLAGSALAGLRLVLRDPPAPNNTTTLPRAQEILDSLLSSSQNSLDSDFLGETSSAYIDKDVEYDDYDEGKRQNDLLHAAKGGEDELPTNGSVVSAPMNLKPVIVKHRFVTLSWEAPALALQPITGYTLMYRVNGSERVQVWRGPPGRREATVGGLSPRTTYRVAAAATTADAVSPLTEVLEITTGEEELTHGPPRDLRGEPGGPHALRLVWSPPDATGAPAAEAPDKYSVHYTEIESGREQVLWVEADPLSSTVTALVGGLRAGALYSVRVSAAGGAGATVRLRTPAAPPAQPPVNVTVVATGATSLLVQWSPPVARSLGGPLTGYKVRYREAPSGPPASRRRAEALTTPADVRRADLTDLEPDMVYQVRVCAMNANGSGPFSEWVSARTAAPAPAREAHVPPQPPPLTTRAGRDWISVWWSTPAVASAPRGWTLGWGLGVPDDRAADLPGHARSHLIRHLEPNSEYVISLRASNALGLGPPVYATVRTRAAADTSEEEALDVDLEEEDEEPEEEPLIPPVGLKVIMLSGSTAVVYWTDPTLPKGQSASDGRRYVVRWSGGGRARTLNASDPNAMLDDLRPHTKYEFAVKLIKGDRESAWSLLATNTTLEAPPSGPPRELRAAPPSPAPPGASSRAVDLTWVGPVRANGVITGYVVMFSAGGAEEWSTLAVGGDRTRARVDRLRPRTTYSFKVQARNSKGLGPFSAPVQFTTTADTGGGGGLAAATSAWLWASAGGACAVLALAAALALSLCCKRHQPPLSPDTSTYQKSSASAAIKPPDLWIHHDQMELKHLDKSLHSSAISAGSAEGGLVASSLTLSRPVDYEPTRGRQLAPTYVECGRASASSAETAPAHRDRCDTCLYTSMTGMGVNTMPTMNTMSSLGMGMGGMGLGGAMGGMGSMGGMGGMGGVGCSATCDRRHQRGIHEQMGGSSLASPHASLASLQPLHQPPTLCAPPCSVGVGGGVVPGGGGDIYASAARERGHYVAYEPLGHYTHRDSLNSEAGAGPGPPSAGHSGPPGHPGHPGGSLPRACAPLHSFSDASEHSTPTHNTRAGSVRESSPYKKSASSSPGHGTNRLHLGGSVQAHPGELEPLSPARSAERLQREMVNLEGLMKDLSAITQHQFHC